jgi:arginine exporter protein ArgO
MIASVSMMVSVTLFAGVAIFLARSGTFGSLTGSTAQAIRYGAAGFVFVGLSLASAQGPRRRQVDRVSDELAALRAYAMSVIVPQALREGLGFIGIMAGLLTASESWIVIFAAASLASQFIGRPRMGDLEGVLRRASSSPERRAE